MNNDPDNFGNAFSLFDRFYKSLRVRKFEESEAVIKQLNGYTTEVSDYRLWADYFSGILAEERDRDWAQTERKYKQVLDSAPPPLLKGHVLLSLGIAQKSQARWAESVQSCNASANLWSELDFPIKQAVALRQLTISLLLGYDFGEFGSDILERATILCQLALSKLGVDEPPEQEVFLYKPDIPFYRAMTWLQLGEIYHRRSDWESALNCYQASSNICSTLDNQYPTAFVFSCLGDIYQIGLSKPHINSLEFYEKALHLYRHYEDRYHEFDALAKIGALYQRNRDWATAKQYYDLAITMIEQVRSGVSSESARMGFFATVINIYDNAILSQLQAKNVKDCFDYMEHARARAFLDKLAGGDAIFTDQLESTISSLTEVQGKLQEDTILLDYYTTGLLKLRNGAITEQQAGNYVLYPTPKTLLFVVTWHDIMVYDLGISPNTLAPSHLDQLIEEHFLPARLRRTLYDLLIAPAAGWLKGKKRLYIIPHGPLHYIPFHALVAPDGDTLLRNSGPEIVYAPSATILFRKAPPREQRPTKTCLAIGYNGEAGMQLRFAEEEAAYIAHMAGGAALVGPSAKKTALYQQAPDYQALHFSCHGEFEPDAPLESVLHIGPDETLTGHEIIDHLRLNCDLVTLSACESGLSKVQRGDELYGLLRAFLYAGAPAIIATLWRVDER